MKYPVIPQKLLLSAMQNSGYRDTAYALAELIDNSLQSGIETSEPSVQTQVEVICIEEGRESGTESSISKIAVFDNAGGMSADVLRKALQFGNGSRVDQRNQSGIGKFGIGLPNSSFSQGKRVDVWSWQYGQVLHSYIDLDDLCEGILIEVPEPKPSTIPTGWSRLFMNDMPDSGTLVVWSKLDRLSWKQSKTLMLNTEFVLGRIYRRFINDKRVSIRLAAYASPDVTGEFESCWESFVKPNDPLYLMTGSSAPSPYQQRSAFEPFESAIKISVRLREASHDVLIRASIINPEARASGYSSLIGRHTKHSQGVSLLRAEREIELSKSFEVLDPHERCLGIEVDFPPALDEMFGVTNNKQTAIGFKRIILEEDAEAASMSVANYKRFLELQGDPRLPMYAISEEIDKLLKSLRYTVANMNGETIASH